jgi:hypothetical protein
MVDLSHSPPDGSAPEQHSHRGVAIPSKSNSTSDARSCCGCLCGRCTCPACCFSHDNLTMPDPNRETYGGQGTSVDGLSTHFSTLNPSSLEAREPKPVVVAPPSLELLSKLNEDTPAQLAETRTEQFVDDIEDAPWRYFLSERSMTSDATEMSGLFFGPIDLEGSMENNAVTSGSRSMLSSYMSAMSVRSDAASALVQHVGEALTAARPTPGLQYLKLL